jgi:hypothetical protein
MIMVVENTGDMFAHVAVLTDLPAMIFGKKNQWFLLSIVCVAAPSSVKPSGVAAI